jgi:hypothetical protein
MKRLLTGLMATAVLASASSAFAATDHDSVGPMPVTGNVPTLCSGGTLTGGNTVFALGTLVDTATGFLLPTLSAPPKTVTGSFCNTRSTITVAALPMTAQSFVGTPPAGFSNTVNYTATASGWTPTAAAFTTGAATNPSASQTRTTAFTGDITVGVSNFTTSGGATLRMVADPVYQGQVTLTLAATS